jgi:ORF6N domain
MPRKTTGLSATDPTAPVELIERRIYLIRGQKVMLDSDLAELYLVETFNVNKAVKRNLDRFPGDFMFQLTNGRIPSLETPNWNLKMQRSALPSLCFHRARRGHALIRTQ